VNCMEDHVGGDPSLAPHVSLSRLGSLCNHSCSPNSGISYNSAPAAGRAHAKGANAPANGRAHAKGSPVGSPANSMRFTAGERGLGPGEQVFLSYIGDAALALPLEERRQQLAQYLFRCGCSRCRAEEGEEWR
jgi:hypothetical protein